MTKKKKGLSRRNFLSKSISGIASIGLLGVSGKALPSLENGDLNKDSKKKIIYRTLGRTGIRLPIVSMGVMNSSNPELIIKSYEIGVRHFDTAAGYMRGRSEETVGNVIKELNVRDKVIIATKALTGRQRRDMNPKQAKEAFLNSTAESLKRLKTDYIDILFFHDVDKAEDLKNPGIQEAMWLLKEQKKARFIGFSTHSRDISCLNEAARSGFFDVVLTSFNYALSQEHELFEAIKKMASKGIGIIAMKTQCTQYFHRMELPTELHKYYKGKVLQTAVLKWVLRNENITTAIPGYTNFKQMEEDFSVAYELEYTPEEKQFLEDRGIQLALAYCHQCKRCIPTCPHQVDIPTLMRIHMYASCYSNFYQARDALDSIPKEQSLQRCKSCNTCKAICVNHINISNRIDELKEIYV